MIWMEVTVCFEYPKATCLTRARSFSTHGSFITVMLSSKNKSIKITWFWGTPKWLSRNYGRLNFSSDCRKRPIKTIILPTRTEIWTVAGKGKLLEVTRSLEDKFGKYFPSKARSIQKVRASQKWPVINVLLSFPPLLWRFNPVHWKLTQQKLNIMKPKTSQFTGVHLRPKSNCANH